MPPDVKTAGLFPAATHREALPLLETTAALRGVMVVTGSPGTGKSTLAKSWMTGLEPKRYLPLLITQPSLTATGVLEILFSKIGERPRFKRSTNLMLLEKHLADIDPVTLVLVLDDAQNYPAPSLEELRLLLGLGGRQRSAFAMILLGDEYLLGGLRLSIQRALFSRISAACQLRPLAPEDIASYLQLARQPRRPRSRHLRPRRPRSARRSQRRQPQNPQPPGPGRMDRRRPCQRFLHRSRPHPHRPAPGSLR